ncbi:hypothetical protein C8R44DRAFT_733221 [Mycena epipterygia]|nr:hypothetical protein C8R44DRAFT_733221 [Mycena epipterygia]
MPPTSMIQRLAIDGKQAWLDGYTSVKYRHSTGDTVTDFPLWTISFWNSVMDIRVQIWNLYIRKLATESSWLLAILLWNEAKCGLSDTEPIHSLWWFLGPKWLSTTDENNMLEILQEKIAGNPELVGFVRVESAYLSNKLAHAFKKGGFRELR